MEFEKIQEIISEHLNISKEKITEKATFEELGADSLDVFQLITELEEIYETEFDASKADKIKSVGDAIKYIQSELES